MIKFIALSLISLLANASNQVHVGILKFRSPAADNKNKFYAHGFYFEKIDGKWNHKVKSVPEPDGIDLFKKNQSSRPDAPAKKMFITFDGKKIGEISVEKDYQIVALKSEKVDRTMGWLADQPRPELLITTTRAAFKDPEKWTAAPMFLSKSEEEKMYGELSSLMKDCSKKFGEPHGQSLDKVDLPVRAVYRPSSLNRLVVRVVNPGCYNWPDAREPGISPTPLWLFKDRAGKWTKIFASALIDIGDYDGDGKSEAVFYRGDATTIPHGEYYIYDLISFEQQANAQDSGTVLMATDFN